MVTDGKEPKKKNPNHLTDIQKQKTKEKNPPKSTTKEKWQLAETIVAGGSMGRRAPLFIDPKGKKKKQQKPDDNLMSGGCCLHHSSAGDNDLLSFPRQNNKITSLPRRRWTRA